MPIDAYFHIRNIEGVHLLGLDISKYRVLKCLVENFFPMRSDQMQMRLG